MLTDTIVRANIALATNDGTDDTFSWIGVGGTSRVPGNIRRFWKADLIARQGGICCQCGKMLDDTAEANHIVTRGRLAMTSDEGKGWKAGNIFIGHRACNREAAARGPVVWPEHMARPDLVPLEWTPFPVLRRMIAK